MIGPELWPGRVGGGATREPGLVVPTLPAMAATAVGAEMTKVAGAGERGRAVEIHPELKIVEIVDGRRRICLVLAPGFRGDGAILAD